MMPMAFIDELKLNLTAGKGGDGVVRWRQEKFTPMGGPSGGNGGKGGDVFFKTTRDLMALERYVHDREMTAENGEAGRSKSQEGKNGEDLVLELPIGTLVRNLDTGEEFDLSEPDMKIKVLTGGRGGMGNEHFKSSTNTTPYDYTVGRDGEHARFSFELRLIADIGLVGLPNAGKSSLLNEITNAKSKVGAYQFTTLDPHLGVIASGAVVADIPGLIEGAHTGKGLGIKFLKHIKRTRVLAHLISFEHESEKEMKSQYDAIRKELDSYDKNLSEKKEIILLTKTDLVDQDRIEKAEKLFAKTGNKVVTVSMFDDADIKKVVKEFSDILK